MSNAQRKKFCLYSLPVCFLLTLVSTHNTSAQTFNPVEYVAGLSKKTESVENKENFKHLGNHIIAEFISCKNLNNIETLKSILNDAALAANATVLSITTHQFQPEGMTGVVVLQESHISVHTWPEFGYASIDIYTCGKTQIEKALAVLKIFFEPKSVEFITIARGFDTTQIRP